MAKTEVCWTGQVVALAGLEKSQDDFKLICFHASIIEAGLAMLEMSSHQYGMVLERDDQLNVNVNINFPCSEEFFFFFFSCNLYHTKKVVIYKVMEVQTVLARSNVTKN